MQKFRDLIFQQDVSFFLLFFFILTIKHSAQYCFQFIRWNLLKGFLAFLDFISNYSIYIVEILNI